MVWDKIFTVSLQSPYLEMIRFWAPTPLGKGPYKGANFLVDNLQQTPNSAG